MESPNSLQPPKPNSTKMRKWPVYAVVLVLVGLFVVLFYSVNGSGKKQAEEKSNEFVDDQRQLASIEGRGLITAPPPGGPAVATPEATPETKGGEPLIVVRDNKGADDEEQRAQARRQAKEQAYFTALSSPLVTKRNTIQQSTKGTVAASPEGVSQTALIQNSGTGMTGTEMMGTGMDQTGQYNPAADKDKEGFFNRNKADEWISPYTRTAGQPYEIKTGTVIPGIMVTGINSDLPGRLIAQVSQNVYDTATGRYLIIPQGAKLFGVYDSRVIYGQERLLVAWNRVIFPDGSAVTLGAMPGSDMGGYAGYEDLVDNHYLRIFGSAFFMSLITGSTSYAVDKLDNSDEDETTVQSALGSALATQMGQTTLSLLQKNLNIKPTLEIRPGYQFNIIITKDVVFKAPYQPMSRGNNG